MRSSATSSLNDLAVWMNGARVGTWSRRRRTPETFRYAESWLDSPAARVLSLSLPFVPGNQPHRGTTVANFFDNLLPDSDAIRRRLRTRFATASTDAFDLLAAIGRDCVGAVQLLRDGNAPENVHRIEAEPLKESEVEAIIDGALSGTRLPGLEDEDEFRISLAGAQEKTALLWHRKRWCRPLGATPTTHILKLPLGLVGNLRADLQDSVENEWLSLRLMRALGLQTAHAEIAMFGERKVLVIERFDRARQGDGWIARLPQEDFCQALGVSPAQKYESDGGPGMRDILRILQTSSHAAADRKAFLRAQIVFWLLAAPDGHAKNFSLFHERGGTYRLTPFYDVLSAWPIIGRGPNQLDERKLRLAMAVRSKNAHWKLLEIQPRHWESAARAAGLANGRDLLSDLAERIPGAVDGAARELPKGFPERVAERIFAGVRRMGTVLERHLAG